ncbi:MAG: prepilin-type N-terminal cleavage/methylation domain-containing protein [Endomicrobiaceae bacterium]|nr:prepilin-type N-terminal cleavage/methylation domain-containing protein [Endomicrobiaceae bacterium]
MIKYLNNIKALTLIEVLVAIILTAIVMLHGTIFFIATWRLSTESKEYNMILNDVIDNLENYISKTYNNSTTIPDNQYVFKTKILRKKYTVTYTLTKDITNFNSCGFYYLTSSARWRYGGDQNSDIRISIKTACAEGWHMQPTPLSYR